MKQLEQLKHQLAKIQSAEKLVKEEVDSEEIADVISKWTGIPVTRLVEARGRKTAEIRRRITQNSGRARRSHFSCI